MSLPDWERNGWLQRHVVGRERADKGAEGRLFPTPSVARGG